MEELRQQYENLGISKQVYDKAEDVLSHLHDRFHKIDKVAEYNQLKVIRAFQNHKISEAHFVATTGYGYNDLGRDTFEEVYADVFKTEDALVTGRRLAREEGLLVGISSGAATWAAIELAKRKENKDKTIVVLLPDTILTSDPAIFKQYLVRPFF